jgi:predicted nuclease of predicted toxin-antitoxin system
VRILLDECIPVDFRHGFPDHEVHSVRWAGFKGKTNGELLRAAEAAGYEVLLTVDQGLPDQNSLVGLKLSILVIRGRTNQMEDLLPFVDDIRKALNRIKAGEIESIERPA